MKKCIFLAAALAALACPTLCRAQITLHAFQLGSDPIHTANLSGASPQSASFSGPSGLATGSANYGSISVTANSTSGQTTSGYHSATGAYTDTITINPTNPALIGTQGTAQFTLNLAGTQAASGYYGYTTYTLSLPSGASISDEIQYGAAFTGTALASSTITDQVGFTFGTPFSATVSLGGQSIGGGGGLPAGSDSVTASVSSGGLSVLNAAGNAPVSASYTSSVGSGSTSVVANGGSYSNISLTNATTGSGGTTFGLMGGTAGADRTVNIAFVAPPAGSAGVIVGDVANLTGLGTTPGQATDMFAAREYYNPSAALGQFGSLSGLEMLWANPANGFVFENAVDGNIGANTPFFAGVGAYNPSIDFTLGYYGIDTTDDYVWAVLNHNSEFAVGQLTSAPEPSRALLLALGSAGVMMRRRRRLG